MEKTYGASYETVLGSGQGAAVGDALASMKYAIAMEADGDGVDDVSLPTAFEFYSASVAEQDRSDMQKALAKKMNGELAFRVNSGSVGLRLLKFKQKKLEIIRNVCGSRVLADFEKSERKRSKNK